MTLHKKFVFLQQKFPSLTPTLEHLFSLHNYALEMEDDYMIEQIQQTVANYDKIQHSIDNIQFSTERDTLTTINASWQGLSDMIDILESDLESFYEIAQLDSSITISLGCNKNILEFSVSFSDPNRRVLTEKIISDILVFIEKHTHFENNIQVSV